MFLQYVVLSEALSTARAEEGPHITVDPLMHPEIADEAKPFSTGAAPMWLLPSMGDVMYSQIALRSERLPT